MSKKEWFLVLIGVGFIAVGLTVNEWLLAAMTSGGRIGAFGQLLIIRLFNITAIGFGVLMITLRRSAVLPKLLGAVVILVITFLAMDALLYAAAPLLPASIVGGMSPPAQVRFYHANQERLPWIYADNVRFARPHTEVELFNIPVVADALGYRNATEHFASAEEIDVLLLGDSFVWGTEEQTIADYLNDQTPWRVYSLGMAGSGIPQWRHHLQRFAAANPQASPDAVVLNFYSGNDVTDTRVFTGLEAARGVVDSADYYTYINFQFLTPTADRKFSLPKLPEFVFLTNYFLQVMKPKPVTAQAAAPSVNGASLPVCLHHREPLPESLGDDVLHQITLAIEAVRTTYPHAHVLLSYIPTSAGIYGDLMTACPDYAADPGRQAAVSALLSDHAAAEHVHYADFTSDLRQTNQETVVWSEIDHFSAAGYALYARLLAERIAELEDTSLQALQMTTP